MGDTRGQLTQWCVLIGDPLGLTCYGLVADDSRQGRDECFRKQCTGRNFLAREDGDVDHRFACLQHGLATLVVVNERFGHWPPCLIALEKQTDLIECHSWLSIPPRIVIENVVDEAVGSQGVLAVAEGFDESRMLVPCHS